MSENLIKKIKVGRKTYGIDYTALENKPTIPADKSAIIIKLAKATGVEDALAHDLYPEVPVITYSCANGITNVKVVKGNAADAAELTPIAANTTIAYNKNGNGYEAGETGDDLQFNLVADLPEGKCATVSTTAESSAYNSLRATQQDAATNTWRIQATKLKADIDVTIGLTDPFTVTYVNYTNYEVYNNIGSDQVAITENLDTAVPEADYKFKVSGFETKPTADTVVTQILCGEYDITSQVKADEGWFEGKGKSAPYSANYKILGSHVTGNLTIVLGTAPVEEPQPEQSGNDPE